MRFVGYSIELYLLSLFGYFGTGKINRSESNSFLILSLYFRNGFDCYFIPTFFLD